MFGHIGLDRDRLYVVSSSGCVTSHIIPFIPETSSQSQSPLSKLRRLADPAEEQATELLAEIELLEIQMALAMYLRFGGLSHSHIWYSLSHCRQNSSIIIIMLSSKFAG